MTGDANADQVAFWSGQAGAAWVARQAQFDGMMTPVLDLLMAQMALSPGETVLDIGCGTGASLLRAGAAVAPGGQVRGLDISRPMLDLARRRVAEAGLDHVEARIADAQTAEIGQGFDAVQSRFGVMFFDDPVAAFANIRRAVRPGGRIGFVTWAGMADNPWFRVPSEAAQARLGPMPPADPHAPGPMAFSDRARVLDILERAGWQEAQARPETLALTPPGDLDAVAEFAGREGPASRIVAHHEGDEADVAAIVAAVAERFAAHVTPEGVRIPARLNVFSATAAG